MEKEPALPKNIRQIGEISGREKICIEDYVMTCIHKKEQQEEKGYLGIFFGERQETEDSVYVFIRGIFEIPAEIQEEKEREALREEYRKYFADWEVQGCCVIGVYPTERMKLLASWIPEAGRLIFHLQEQEETLYWVSEERYKRLRGYFVFYEQNRKMQEYLADVFGDNSVEKEGTPDKAIRSFREKVKEKGEVRRGSFLRMASSFFVITVLIIGAIVVNRIEDIRTARSAVSGGEDIAVYHSQQGEEYTQSIAESDAGMTTPDAAAAESGQQEEAQTETADAGLSAAQEVSLTGSDAFWETVLEDDPEWEERAMTAAGQEAQTDSGESTADTELNDGSDGTENQNEEETDAEQTPDAEADLPEDEAQEAAAVRHTQAGYIIKEGDTLAGICGRYYGNLNRLDEICEVNGIQDANMILPGQRIVLP